MSGGVDGREILQPYPEVTRAGVTALARALELHDPVAARRAAWRVAIIKHWLLETDANPAVIADSIGAALLVDLAHLVAPGPTWATTDISGAVLGASLLGQLPQGQRCALVVRHVHERWDGDGGPHALGGLSIPVASRIVSIASALTGKLVNRQEPNWLKRIRKLDEQIGSRFDRTSPCRQSSPWQERRSIRPRCQFRLRCKCSPDLSDGDGSPVAHQTLETIGTTLQAAMRSEQLIALIADQTRIALAASRVSIGKLEDDASQLRVLINAGDLGRGERRHPKNETYPLVALPSFTAFVTGTSHIATKSDEDRSVTDYLDRRQLASEIAATARSGSSTWLVWATRRNEDREFDDDDLKTLQLAADQLAHGLQQAATIEQYERYAFRDALTGLSNRRVLDTKLREIFSRPEVDRTDCAVIMCDVDELKVANDTDGHESGR